MKLEVDAEIDLFEVVLKNATIYRFRDGPTVTWQSNEYEYYPCQVTGDEPVAGTEDNRPTFTIVNNENVFGPIADSGVFELAVLYRRRVLQGDLAANNNIYQQKLWLVGRCMSITNRQITFELRSPLDIPNFRTPTRSFMPPEFPTVSL